MVRIKDIEKLTLKEMMFNINLYSGLPDGLIQLPVPDFIRIDGKRMTVPQDLKEFTDHLCYGQRMFLAQKEDNDFGVIIRIMDGYYYPLFTRDPWDDKKAILFGRKIILCNAGQLYPVANHLMILISQMIEREHKLLYRNPSKIELAAGIEKLNLYSEWANLDFLSNVMKCTIPEVLLQPYNECLTRFMQAHDTNEFQERYFELMKKDSEPKSKFAQ